MTTVYFHALGDGGTGQEQAVIRSLLVTAGAVALCVPLVWLLPRAARPREGH